MLSIDANAATGDTKSRSNFIVIFIDDMGWGDFSCFGNQSAKTPSMDRLASEGIRFAQFYVNSPICSPSRTALTTGQYPQRWRIGSYLSNREENARRGIADWLDPRAPTLARILQHHGYATGHFGKWHMGGQRDVGDAPSIADYGFDESLTNFEGLGPRLLPLLETGEKSGAKRYALGSDRLGRGPILWTDRTQVTSGYVRAAIEFAKKSNAGGKPFFINVWPDDVHSPFFPQRAKRGDGSKRTLYHAVLESMDEQLEDLFSFVRNDPQLRANTLVLVCSDNGPEPGAGSSGPFRGAKTTLYEGGIRSPLIVWGPGLVEPAKHGTWNDTSHLVAMDVAPTLLQVARIEVPENIQFDGEPLAETILGRAESSRRQPIYWRRPPDRKTWSSAGLNSPLPDLAMRDGNWKLLCEYDGSKPELYDLEIDRGEAANKAAEQTQVVAAMTKRLLHWHHSLPPDHGQHYQPAVK